MKIRSLFFLVISTIISVFLYGNDQKNIDKLLKNLETADNSQKVGIYLSLSEEYIKEVPEKALEYSQKALSISKLFKNPLKEALALEYYANANYRLNNSHEAITYYLKALEIYQNLFEISKQKTIYKSLGGLYLSIGNYPKSLDYIQKFLRESLETGDIKELAEAYNFLGIIYNNINDYVNSIKYYIKALKIYEELKDNEGLANTTTNLGIIYYNNQNTAKSLEYHQKSLAMSKKMNNKTGIARSLNNIGMIYFDKKEFDKALNYFSQSLSIFLGLEDNTGIGTTSSNISLIFMNKSDYNNAIRYADIGLKTFKKINDRSGIANTYNNIANINLRFKSLNNVTPNLDSAIAIAQAIGTQDLLAEAYQIYSDYFEAKKDNNSALKYFKMFYNIKSKLLSIQKSKNLAELDTKYELSKKEREIELLNKDKEKQKIIKNSLIFFSVFIVLLIIVIFSRFLLKQRMLKLIKHKNTLLTQSEIELKELNSTKDRFFSIIAHDLRSPFNSLLGFSELLAENYAGFSEEQIADISKQINIASKKLFNLLENLLQWSMSQTRNIKYLPEQFDLGQIINETTSLFSFYFEQKNISLTSSINKGDYTVFCDKNSISAVLRNLISNAIKFTNENGKIEISAKRNGNYVEVAISDNGVGIPEEEKDKIFNLDYKSTSKGTNNEPGTGLGLIISKEFVEKNDGTLHFTSEKNNGSTFYFTIPLL